MYPLPPVSVSLRGGIQTSPEPLKRITDAADAAGRRPNPIAQNLRPAIPAYRWCSRFDAGTHGSANRWPSANRPLLSPISGYPLRYSNGPRPRAGHHCCNVRPGSRLRSATWSPSCAWRTIAGPWAAFRSRAKHEAVDDRGGRFGLTIRRQPQDRPWGLWKASKHPNTTQRWVR
jgi:hypothetical protein